MNFEVRKGRIIGLALLFAGLATFQGLLAAEKHETAILAGGCFWCVESDLEKVPGVLEAVSGYTGGKKVSPTYKEVAGGKTTHTEAVQVTFDPKRISYSELLEYFWRGIDPTDLGGQFVDRGSQYRPEIFYLNDKQLKAATESKKKLIASKRFKKPIVVPITKATAFYPAEDYHQDFYKKSPIRYTSYRVGSGRDRFGKDAWGKDYKYDHMAAKRPSKEELRKKLTKVQYFVTQEDGTEPPFRNEYHDNKKPGIYVDIVSKEPLFSSTHKYDSKTGWPSFYKPLESANIVERSDRKLFYERIEVRSKGGDSHLGHVFKDGPEPTGLRYCINSAALEFIPVNKLEERGFGQYLSLFKNKK